MKILKKKKKKHIGKAKARLSASSILKNKFDKDNFLKKYMEKYCSKTKTMYGKHCSNPYYFFLNYKTKFSTNLI
jgi:hypothetical protein